MTPSERTILTRSLLLQLLGGLGAGFYVAEFCNSQILQDHILHGLAPSLSPSLPRMGFLPWIIVACALLAGSSCLYAHVLSKKLGVKWLDVFARDAESNAVLVLALVDPVVSLLESGLLGLWDTVLLYRFAYLGVFTAGLWIAAKVTHWLELRHGGPEPEPEARDRVVRFVWVACGVYILIFGTMGVLQCLALNVAHIDSVIFERMYWNTLHGRFAVFDTDTHSFMAEHVSLTMYLLLPLYALYPSLQTISVFQTVALGLGGVPAYLIARELLKSRGAALAFAIAYLMNPALHYSNLEVRDTIFDPNTFSAALLLCSFYFALSKRWRLYLLTGALAMLSREDVCPSVFMMGLYLAVVRKERKYGLIGAGMGLGWLLLGLYVIGPYYRAKYEMGAQSLVFNYFSGMGQGLSGMIHHVLTEPIDTLFRVTTERDACFFLDLALPFGLLSLLAPEALLMAGPAFAFSLLADERWVPIVSAQFWYHIVHVPLVFIASVVGASHLPGIVAWLREHWPRWAARELAMPAPRTLAVGAASLALVCSLLLSVLTSKWPLSISFYDRSDRYRHWSVYVAPPEARHIPQIQQMIPRTEPVVTTHYLTQKFSHHPDVWRFPGKIDEVNWIVVNRNDRFFRQGFDTSGDQEKIRQLYQAPEFEVVFEKDGLVVFKRRAAVKAGDGSGSCQRQRRRNIFHLYPGHSPQRARIDVSPKLRRNRKRRPGTFPPLPLAVPAPGHLPSSPQPEKQAGDGMRSGSAEALRPLR